MNVYIKFMRFDVLLIKFYEKYIEFHKFSISNFMKSTLNFINFHYKFSHEFQKYIKFYVHRYIFVINTLNLM